MSARRWSSPPATAPNAVGLEGESTTTDGGSGSGGTDVWFNLSEAPEYSILPPSSTYGRDENGERYIHWSTALDTDPNWLEADQFARQPRNDQRFTAVGYGLEKVLPFAVEGGDTRRQSTLRLVNLNSGFGVPAGTSVVFSNNNGKSAQGGTYFGDSGGPIFEEGTTIIVAVTSFGSAPTAPERVERTGSTPKTTSSSWPGSASCRSLLPDRHSSPDTR